MGWLPGWDSIDDARWFHNFFELGGIVLFLAVVGFELLAYFYGQRHEWLGGEAVRAEREQRDRADGEAEKRHAAEVEKLREQLEETRKQVAEDHGLKKRIRALFNSIDPQILRAIDGGQTALNIRMQPSDIENLRRLAAEPDAVSLLRILGISGAWMRNSMIGNGTLGPQGAVPLQTTVEVEVSRALAVSY